jgi:acyl-CoA synthetase (AMP-forming)/AMP-acid ligase II
VIEGRTLWELIERRAAATPDALFAVDEADRSLTFAGYREAVSRAAAGLARRGIGPGVPVSWVLPTRLSALVLAGALARLSAVQNPILPIYRHREVGFCVRQTGARLLLVPSIFRKFDYAAMAREIAAGCPGLDLLVVDHELPEGDPQRLPPPPESAAAEAAPVRWIFYTSGTTADPKGARHTDATLLVAGQGLVRTLELRPDDRIALVFPVTHIGGPGWLMAGLLSGAAQIAVESFGPASVDLLARHGVTIAGAGTAFHQTYLAVQRERGGARVFPRVRSFPGGGAPKPPQLHFDLKKELGGVGIVSGYGLTECPIIAMNTVRDPDPKLAFTEGRPNPPEARIRVVRLDGREAGPGEEGELRVLGPQLCKGYLDRSLDAEAFDERGFFRTGDLGFLDADGFAVITGRIKDVIIRKGENISAKEVEDLLYQHPKVADVAVIGLPDPATGERCCAVVACKDASDPLRFDEMAAFLRERKLMLQKIPEQLELVEEVPRNPAGKIQKKELRQRFGGS